MARRTWKKPASPPTASAPVSPAGPCTSGAPPPSPGCGPRSSPASLSDPYADVFTEATATVVLDGPTARSGPELLALSCSFPMSISKLIL